MTLRQGLLAALLALVMMGSMSAGLWLWWYVAVRLRARPMTGPQSSAEEAAIQSYSRSWIVILHAGTATGSFS